MAKRIVIFADGTGNGFRRDPVFIQPPHRARFIAAFTADNSGDPSGMSTTQSTSFGWAADTTCFIRTTRHGAVWLQETPLPEKPLEQAAR
jgi:hypothetical protein